MIILACSDLLSIQCNASKAVSPASGCSLDYYADGKLHVRYSKGALSVHADASSVDLGPPCRGVSVLAWPVHRNEMSVVKIKITCGTVTIGWSCQGSHEDDPHRCSHGINSVGFNSIALLK